MKSLIIILVFIINSTFPLFAFIGDQRVFNLNWNYSPIVNRQIGNTEIQMKLFSRTIWINQTEIPLVETTFTYLKNPEGKTNLKQIANDIQKNLKKINLKITNNQNHFKLEGPYSKLNRQLKIDLKQNGNNFLIITSFIRLGFLKKLNVEVENLHETLLSYNGEVVSNKTSWIKWIQNFTLKDAYADGVNLTTLLGITSNTTSPTSADLNINLKATELQKNIGDLNTTVGSTNQNWGNTNNQLGNATNQLGNSNNNWANTNNQLGNTNNNIHDFNKEVGGMNTNWAESNKVMAQMLDADRMGKVAFYTAAGAALGAISVNLAVQGVNAGVSFLYELFTGTNKKKIEWEDLEKAMSVWDTQLNDLTKLEQAVDSYLSAFDFFEGKNLTNDYVKQLSDAMRDMRFDRDVFMEHFYKDQNLTIECRKIYYNAADELNQKLKEYEKIIEYATKNNIKSGPNYFCNQLNELQRKILTAELQMQKLRTDILKAENQFYTKEGIALDKREDTNDRVNENLDKTLAEKKKYDEKIIDRLKETHQKNKDSWIESCLDGKNEQGIKINNENKGIFGGFFSHFKRKELCGNEYEKISQDVIARDNKSAEMLAQDEELRKNLKIKANNFVDVKLSEEQMNWMTRLHVDAFCFQFAHEKEDKVPQKCKDYPELLYSMSLSKGYDKAHEAYDHRCQDRYLSGIKKLNEQPKN